MPQTSEPESSVEELMSRMREGALRRRIDDSFSASSSDSPAHTNEPHHDDGNGDMRFASATTLAHAPLALQPEFEPHADDSYHARDLLKYHDRDFVQNAYRAILKRQPDDAGFNDFIEGLRTARLDKIDVLAQLRRSPEGKEKNVRVDGVWRPAALRSLYRLPVVGYFAQLIISLLRLPAILRGQRQHQSYLIAQQQLIADYFNDAHARLATAAASLRDAQQHQQLAHEELNDRLTAARQTLETDLAALTDRVELMDGSMKSIFAQLSHDVDMRFAQLSHDVDTRFAQLSRDVNTQFTQLSHDVNAQFTQLRRHADSLFTQSSHDVDVRFTQSSRDTDLRFTQLSHATNTQFTQLSHDADTRFDELTQHYGFRFTQLGDHIEARFAESTAGLQQQKEAQRNRLESLARELKDETERILQKHQETRAELALQSRRISMLLEDARRQLESAPDTVNAQLQTLAAEDAHTHDALYISLEDQLRGSRAAVSQRLSIYLPLIRAAQIGSEAMPVLDIGCGRGEWLELLKAEGLNAIGVDTNSIAAGQCRERGLDARETDALTYLRALPPEGVGAVTAFHVVEHLPFDVLMKLLDECVRVIKPGGALIFETPNPQNVLVGSCNFYFDPTHRNPLPIQTLKFLVESRGFTRVEAMTLHPSEMVPVAGDSELARRFNEYFYGAMDYAVIGWKARA